MYDTSCFLKSVPSRSPRGANEPCRMLTLVRTLSRYITDLAEDPTVFSFLSLFLYIFFTCALVIRRAGQPPKIMPTPNYFWATCEVYAGEKVKVGRYCSRVNPTIDARGRGCARLVHEVDGKVPRQIMRGCQCLRNRNCPRRRSKSHRIIVETAIEIVLAPD